MRVKRQTAGIVGGLVSVVVAFSIACTSEDPTPEPNTKAKGAARAGAPCKRDDECVTEFCITDETFTALTEGKQVPIPGGYCSKVPCTTDDECGEGGTCWNLSRYPAVALTVGVCLKSCQSPGDCRDGYLCHNGAAADIAAQPKSACLTPDLLCLLAIPTSACPADGGTDGGDNAADDASVDAPVEGG